MYRGRNKTGNRNVHKCIKIESIHKYTKTRKSTKKLPVDNWTKITEIKQQER